MNSTRMAILAVATLAGVGCVGVVLHGMASAHKPVAIAPPPPVEVHPTVRVLVAKHDLTVGERIAAADMTWQTWPAEALNPAFITDGPPVASAPSEGQLAHKVNLAADAVKGAMSDPSKGAGAALLDGVVREKIMANEPITNSKVVHTGTGGVMAVTLDPGMRAVALPLTAESAAGGFVLPGDHVDVLMTRGVDTPQGGASTSGSPTAGHITTTVMRNVRVLAIDQNTGAKASSVIGATATVECTPAQAEYLVLAKASGTLTLMLRSYADAKGPAEIAVQSRGAPADKIIRVFRNSVVTPVTVSQ